MIYFVHAATTPVRVKIGVTADFPGCVAERVRSLQTCSPVKLTLLGCARGSTREERRLHVLFARQRRIGEWFEIDAELRGLIATLRPPEAFETAVAGRIVAVSAAISASARDELVRIAAKEDRTFSYVVRRIIENYLTRRARAEKKRKTA